MPSKMLQMKTNNFNPEKILKGNQIAKAEKQPVHPMMLGIKQVKSIIYCKNCFHHSHNQQKVASESHWNMLSIDN